MVIYFYIKTRQVRLEYDVKHYKDHGDYVVIGIPDQKNPEQAVLHNIPKKDIREFRSDEQDRLMRKHEKDDKIRNYLTGY